MATGLGDPPISNEPSGSEPGTEQSAAAGTISPAEPKLGSPAFAGASETVVGVAPIAEHGPAPSSVGRLVVVEHDAPALHLPDLLPHGRRLRVRLDLQPGPLRVTTRYFDSSRQISPWSFGHETRTWKWSSWALDSSGCLSSAATSSTCLAKAGCLAA